MSRAWSLSALVVCYFLVAFCGAPAVAQQWGDPSGASEIYSVAPYDMFALDDEEADDLLSPQADARGGAVRRVYRDRVTPTWFADNTRFWYRNDLAGGRCEFIVVDATR